MSEKNGGAEEKGLNTDSQGREEKEKDSAKGRKGCTVMSVHCTPFSTKRTH